MVAHKLPIEIGSCAQRLPGEKKVVLSIQKGHHFRVSVGKENSGVSPEGALARNSKIASGSLQRRFTFFTRGRYRIIFALHLA